MDRAEAREYLKQRLTDYVEQITTRSAAGFYVCPLCKSGTGKKKTGAFSIQPDGTRWKCFSCDESGDIFDLIGKVEGLPEYNEQLKRAADIFSVTIDRSTGRPLSWDDTITQDYQPRRSTPEEDFGENQNQPKTERAAAGAPRTVAAAKTEEAPEEVRVDFTSEVKAAHAELLRTPDALQYYLSRGLSMETVNAYELGYDAAGYNHLLQAHPDHKTGSKKAGLYRYVLPYPDGEGRYSYFITEIIDRSQVDEWNGKYRKITKGSTDLKAQIFNERYIKSAPASVIFICEGIYDALSVEEAGGKAIAFVGTAHVRFLGLCKRYRPDVTFIISLDNDGAGQQAIEKVKEGLDALGIPYKVRTAQGAKDFNEALQQDRKGFTEYIQQVIAEVEQERQTQEEAERLEYFKTSTTNYIQGFVDGIAESVNTPATPTGFDKLDTILDGGLYEGLYIFGAISSLGKTTLVTQIADQIAQRGRDVLIFSLEMARTEIMSKSISRLTLQDITANGGNIKDAKTARGITAGARYQHYSRTERELINRAITTYSTYTDHLFISEGVGNIGAAEIRETVERHVKYTGAAPVIVVDYLQILAPYNDRATDKQNTDKAVLELKRISRDYKTPVIGISSFNRQNYRERVTMEAFKESGAIEYSSDVLIGLQLQGAGEKDFDVDRAKAKSPRDIELVILKNRNGQTGRTIAYRYYPLFNFFEEV